MRKNEQQLFVKFMNNSAVDTLAYETPHTYSHRESVFIVFTLHLREKKILFRSPCYFTDPRRVRGKRCFVFKTGHWSFVLSSSFRSLSVVVLYGLHLTSHAHTVCTCIHRAVCCAERINGTPYLYFV